MGTLRLHPSRLGGLNSRAVINVWSVFDFQLALYALALVVMGLLLLLEYGLAASTVAVGWSGYAVGVLEHLVGIHIPPEFANGPYAGGIINLPAVIIVGLVTPGATDTDFMAGLPKKMLRPVADAVELPNVRGVALERLDHLVRQPVVLGSGLPAHPAQHPDHPRAWARGKGG